MVGGQCPNCGKFTNDSSSRLVRDACGHRKCRLCLVYEEEGCKACQNEHRIQMIGSFDYPTAPSSQSVANSNGSGADSEKEEIVLQPLELVTIKTTDHDRVSEWIDDRDMDVRNTSDGRTVEGTSCFDNDPRNSNQSSPIASSQDRVNPDEESSVNRRDFGRSEILTTKVEPLELVTNVRDGDESEDDREDLSEPNMDNGGKNGEGMHQNPENGVQKLKGRKICRLKRNHISVIPGEQEMYKCNICCKTFKNATAKKYHDSCLTGSRRYQCTMCDKSFVKQSHYQYHERTHTGYKPFECPICGKTFPQRNKLNRHLHSHQEEKRFKCSICDKGYSNREDLKSHVNLHSGLTPYACKVCKKLFRESANLTRHMHTHSKERPHMCEQCGKSFKDKSLLVRHRRTHGNERPFSCSDCTRVFLSKSELSRHLAVHSEDKPFPCPHCSTVFRRKDNLNRHTRHHHSEDQISRVENKCAKKETELVKPKAANVTKPKFKPKDKPKSSLATLPKSPAKISVHYFNSLEQINSRLDSRSNVIPVIRTTNELSNAVPVINGPISIKRPEETTNSPKKAFTHTEPIPLAEAVVINRRIEEKLYPKTDLNDDCYFRPDFRNRIDRQQATPKIKPLRPNLGNRITATGKIYSPEPSFFEPLVSQGKTQLASTRKPVTTESGIDTRQEMFATWNDSADAKGSNIPKHTVPKKRAIEEMKSQPTEVDSSDLSSGLSIKNQTHSCVSEPDGANCVRTITKAGHINSVNDLKEFNSDNKMFDVNGIKKLSDIHWRRRTSEILKPRIQGIIDVGTADEMTEANSRGFHRVPGQSVFVKLYHNPRAYYVGVFCSD